jgi:hypothetical protein
VNSLVGGLAEPLRFGSTAGALSGSGHATAGQIALGTLQEAGRAAAIIPVGAAIGKGTGALVTSLSAGGEDEALGEMSGLLDSTCFVAGTLVATESGYVGIQNVNQGDLVWSYSLREQEWQLRPVEAALVHDYSGDVITINVGGALIEATGNHPFWVISGEDLASRPLAQDLPEDKQIFSALGRWVEARSLKIGDGLMLIHGGAASVSSLTVRQDHLLVYNLHVTDNNTYAVSQAGILVHNKSAQIKPVPRDTGVTSRAARRQAMRDQDIPTSQQPLSQSENASGREYTYEVPKPGGGTQLKSVQDQTLDSSHPGQGHWEAGTAKTDPTTGNVIPNNSGRPRLKSDKSKVDYNE